MSQCTLLGLTLAIWFATCASWAFAVPWFETMWRYKLGFSFPDFVVLVPTLTLTVLFLFTVFVNLKPDNKIVTIHKCLKDAVIACR